MTAECGTIRFFLGFFESCYINPAQTVYSPSVKASRICAAVP